MLRNWKISGNLSEHEGESCRNSPVQAHVSSTYLHCSPLLSNFTLKRGARNSIPFIQIDYLINITLQDAIPAKLTDVREEKCTVVGCCIGREAERRSRWRQEKHGRRVRVKRTDSSRKRLQVVRVGGTWWAGQVSPSYTVGGGEAGLQSGHSAYFLFRMVPGRVTPRTRHPDIPTHPLQWQPRTAADLLVSFLRSHHPYTRLITSLLIDISLT